MFTAVLMASLPPALNVFVIANQYQVYVERASTAILVGTLASVVTVTAPAAAGASRNQDPVRPFPWLSGAITASQYGAATECASPAARRSREHAQPR